jgi:transposase
MSKEPFANSRSSTPRALKNQPQIGSECVVSASVVSASAVEQQFAAFIGIDRSDRHLDVCLQVARSTASSAPARSERTRIANTPEAWAQWMAELTARFPASVVAICLEQPAAALIEYLAHSSGALLFPVNPLTLARYREAFTTSRAKDDAGDAAYLMELVRDHRDKLSPWRPDDATTRSIALLCEGRRKAVDLRTGLGNALLAHLKSYFPQAVELCGDDLYSVLSCDFLVRWPSLQELKRAREKTVRAFYSAHNCRSRAAIEKRLLLLRESVAVSDDAALLRGSIPTTRMYALQLKAMTQAIAEFDKEIAALLEVHDDAALFSSLPGAGPVHSARLLCAFGSDRERYQSAQDLQQYSGIAPVVKASGKVRLVQRRFARPLFLHQSFIEYSDQSIRHCAWAKAFYHSQRAKGKGHWAAVRALAYKWIRIIFACWKNKVAYDDAKYLEALRKSRSPLIALMETASEAKAAATTR